MAGVVKTSNPNRATAATETSIAVDALGLLGRWQRVRNGHLAFTSGCACSFGGSIDLAEFDELIVDYLQQKFARDPAVTAFIAACARAAPGQPGQPGQSGHLGRVLHALARTATRAGMKADSAAGLTAEQARAVLEALEGSIASIEEQHPV